MIDANGKALAGTVLRRRIAAGCLSVVALWLLLLLVSAPTRLAARTVLLLPSFFAVLPGPPPLNLTTAQPVREVAELPAVDGFVRAHVYRPAQGRHGALVLSLGLGPAPTDDPRVVRLLDGLARSGLVTVLIESEALNHDQLYPDLPDVLAEGVRFTADQPYVRRDRVGLFGFSVAGSLALIAAARPEIGDQLRFVEAFGAYATLDDALLSVATHTLQDGATVRRWEPDLAAQTHLADALIASLSNPDEADQFRRHFVAGDPAPIDAAALSPDAQALYRLLTTRDRGQGAAALAQLPPIVAQNLTALTPLPLVTQVRPPIYVMYDHDDPLLPFTGSRAICRAAAAAHPYCSVFSIFKHVDPTRLNNPAAVLHDLLRLYLHVVAVLQLLE